MILALTSINLHCFSCLLSVSTTSTLEDLHVLTVVFLPPSSEVLIHLSSPVQIPRHDWSRVHSRRTKTKLYWQRRIVKSSEVRKKKATNERRRKCMYFPFYVSGTPGICTAMTLTNPSTRKECISAKKPPLFLPPECINITDYFLQVETEAIIFRRS